MKYKIESIFDFYGLAGLLLKENILELYIDEDLCCENNHIFSKEFELFRNLLMDLEPKKRLSNNFIGINRLSVWERRMDIFIRMQHTIFYSFTNPDINSGSLKFMFHSMKMSYSPSCSRDFLHIRSISFSKKIDLLILDE